MGTRHKASQVAGIAYSCCCMICRAMPGKQQMTLTPDPDVRHHCRQDGQDNPGCHGTLAAAPLRLVAVLGSIVVQIVVIAHRKDAEFVAALWRSWLGSVGWVPPTDRRDRRYGHAHLPGRLRLRRRCPLACVLRCARWPPPLLCYRPAAKAPAFTHSRAIRRIKDLATAFLAAGSGDAGCHHDATSNCHAALLPPITGSSVPV